METFVALVRNFACVVKSLLHSDHAVMVPLEDSSSGAFLLQSLTHPPGVPFPTMLEVFIGSSQFLGALFNLRAGLANVSDALRNRRRAQQCLELGRTGKRSSTVTSWLEVQSQKVADSSMKFLLGVSLLTIGEGFVALFLANFKRIPLGPVIWSLTASQFALGYLLWVMWDGVRTWRRIGRHAEAAAAANASTKALPIDVLDQVAKSVGRSEWNDTKEVETLAQAEAAASELDQWRTDISTLTTPKTLQNISQTAYSKAHFEFIILLLNVIAFIGYGFIPITYFVPEEYVLDTKLHTPLGLFDMRTWWPGHDMALWAGNLAGDVAWTVEPALVLAVAALARRRIASTDTKMKVA